MTYERTDRFSCGHTYKVGRHGKNIEIAKCPTCDKGTYESSLVKTDEKMKPLQPVIEEQEHQGITFTSGTTIGTLYGQAVRTTSFTGSGASGSVGDIYGESILHPTRPVAEGADLPAAPHISYDVLQNMWHEMTTRGSSYTERLRPNLNPSHTSPTPFSPNPYHFDEERTRVRHLYNTGAITLDELGAELQTLSDEEREEREEEINEREDSGESFDPLDDEHDRENP